MTKAGKPSYIPKTFIFFVSLVLAFITGAGVFNLLLRIFNSLFPAITRDTLNREVHVMPVGNMIWSLALGVTAGVFVLTIIFTKLKKTYGISKPF
jgi:hypothetical protein